MGGRWNSPGVAVVYTAESLALAVLEYFVHVPPALRTAGKMPPLVAVHIELPEGAGVETLPADFGSLHDQLRTRALGDAWKRAGRTLALRVPSRVVPQEWNLLLNPGHPDMADVRVRVQEPFALDPRLAP